MMTPYSFSLPDLEATHRLAATLASHSQMSDVILLQGDLGVGKTAFAKYFINTLLDVPENVPSPTFTLVQTFNTAHFPIWHFDLYRLEYLEEAYELGIEDALAEGVALIEWPAIIADILPSTTLSVTLSYGKSDDSREVTLQGNERLIKSVMS